MLRILKSIFCFLICAFTEVVISRFRSRASVAWLSSLSLTLVLFSQQSLSANDTIRVGVLEYGTVRWELDVIEKYALDKQYNLNIEVVKLASTQASLTALQSGAVDVIVGDWIWVAAQKRFNRHFYFYPYSNSAAPLMLPKASHVTELAQLKGKTVGFAGGPVNKNWVFYRAYARQFYGLDLTTDLTVKFSSPPVLNALLLNDQLDAVVNFWHFSARLTAQGARTLITMNEVLEAFELNTPVPVLGWVFSKRFGDERAELIEQFLGTSYSARKKLLQDDALWLELPSLTNSDHADYLHSLRADYRDGIPQAFGPKHISAMQTLMTILVREAGVDWLGGISQLPGDVFWQSRVLPEQ